jgi:uncharacterized membrane protein
MRSRVRVAGHAVHPMLVVFPLGLLGISVVFDILGLATGQNVWGTVAYWDIAAGLVMGLAAGLFGFLDLLGIPSGTRAARVGLMHAIFNVVVLGLFAVSFAIRTLDRSILPSALAFILSVTGLGLAVISGWLGGELVEQLGVSVSEEAGLNAPSSLHVRRSPSRKPLSTLRG